MSRTPSEPPIDYVDSSKGLTAVVDAARSAGRFAFDTEFVMEDRYAPEICLIQVATEDTVAVIDPKADMDLSPIWELVTDPKIEVIVHAGMEDMAIAQAESGKLPQKVFDCQVACGLIGPEYPLSLSRMVQAFLRVRLRKSQTLTDWRRRPLTDAQLQYGAADVAYLPAVHRQINKRLKKLGRAAWMDEEMAKFSDEATYVRNNDDAPPRLKGAGSLDARGLAIARELLKTRDTLAAKYNRPVRAVVRDHLLVEIARHHWSKAADIRTLRGLHLRKDGINALAEAVQRAMKLPEEECPQPPPPAREETEEEASLAMLIHAVIRHYCQENDIAHSLVASKAHIRSFVRTVARGQSPHPKFPLSSGWRAETAGAVARDVLEGRVKVTVKSTNIGPMIELV